MLCVPPFFPSPCNVSPLVPLLCLGPSLVQWERKAWEGGNDRGSGERRRFQGGGPRKKAGGWEPTLQ